jgi:hypothetical protein
MNICAFCDKSAVIKRHGMYLCKRHNIMVIRLRPDQSQQVKHGVDCRCVQCKADRVIARA